jgi:hypothetical protein
MTALIQRVLVELPPAERPHAAIIPHCSRELAKAEADLASASFDEVYKACRDAAPWQRRAT